MRKIKALIVSQLPWSHSNRGIDILTEALTEIDEIEVHHLVFPHNFNFLTKVAENHPRIKQLYAKKQYLFYYDKLMWWLPKSMTKLIIKHTINSAKNINFKDFDIIILESGNATLLKKLITEDKILIYRQSDSMKELLNKNPVLWEVEDEVIERADLIFVVSKYFKSRIPEKHRNKTIIVVNGFNIPKKISAISPFPKSSKNVVYLGYAPIDFGTVKFLVENNPKVNFHIIGRGLKPIEILKLRKFHNFKHHGILNAQAYLPFMKYCDLFIVPYKESHLTKVTGLTSKYLLAMYFKKPIISYPVGFMEEFKGLPVHFVKTKEEFDKELKRVLKEEKEVDYDIDFEYYSSEGRKREYKDSIIKLLKEKRLLN